MIWLFFLLRQIVFLVVLFNCLFVVCYLVPGELADWSSDLGIGLDHRSVRIS